MKHTLDFLVIGAQKSGTTSLFEYMRGHPQLHLPDSKEVPYFSHGQPPLSWPEYLERWFGAADPTRRWGTVTPQYMAGGLLTPDPGPGGGWGDPHTVPSRIRERLPDVRLIAILRDPVERARSHYDWARQAGWETEPFEATIDQLLTADALEAARAHPQERSSYITWGEYGRILAGYFDAIPAENILVVYTSELGDAPVAVMRRVFGFLGVAEDHLPPNLGAVYRPSAVVARRLPDLQLGGVKARLASQRHARRLWRALPESVRRQADHQFERLGYSVETLNRRQPRTEFPHAQVHPAPSRSVDPHLEQALRAHYEADGRRLASLVGAPPPWLREPPGARDEAL